MKIHINCDPSIFDLTMTLSKTISLTPASTEATLTPSFSKAEFRQALGMFATGVTIISARAPDGSLVGLTANSFNSVSLDPPLILWSLGLKARSLEQFKGCEYYAVNVLTAHQTDLAMNFSRSDGNRFEGVDYDLGFGGTPIIKGSLATFECSNRSQYEEGDHIIFVGHVQRVTATKGQALIYQDGRFAGIAVTSD